MRLLRLALLLAGAALALPAAAQAPPDRLQRLAHGVNFTNWFRYPARQDDDFLRDYIDDATLFQLRAAGFSFVRVAVQPEIMLDGSGLPDAHRLGILAAAIGRIELRGLAVMVGWHPQTWDLQNSPVQQRQLLELWGALAQRLRPLDPGKTFPEVLNEPVYDGAAPAWEALQVAVLARIRAELPQATVVLTGNHWGSIDGLLALQPVADGNVVYSFHTYDPPSFTSMASFEHGLDTDALKRLPFPASNQQACEATAKTTAHARTADIMRFYCSEHWDDAKLRETVTRAAEWGRRNHVALVAGEFGASNELPVAARLAWIGDMRMAFEDNGIGWALWGYDDSMGFALHPHNSAPPPPPLDAALLRALGLSHDG
jgi:endoglucanase